MVDGQIVQFLHEAARPSNRRAHGAACISESKEDIFAVLRKKSRSGLQRPRLLAGAGFDRDKGADRITVALRPLQAKCDRRRQSVCTTFFKSRNCGALRFFRHSSSRPS